MSHGSSADRRCAERPMVWEYVRHNKSEMGQKIRNRWIELTVKDMAYIDVYRDRLIERLTARYLMTGEQATRQVSKWEGNLVLPGECARLRPRSKT